jgi:hypothetical protein
MQSFSVQVRIILLFTCIFFPILYFLLVFFLTNIGICYTSSTYISILKACNETGILLENASDWLIPLVAIIISFFCAYIFVGFQVNKGKIVKVTVIKIIFAVLALLISALIYIISFFTVAFAANGYKSDAKILYIPVLNYARTHEWKTVLDENIPGGIDTPIPSYSGAFLTTQTRDAVKEDMINLLENAGYSLDNKFDTDQTSVTPGTDITLSGKDTYGTQMLIIISDTGYNDASGNTITTPKGMTAINFEITDYGFSGKKQQNFVQ